MKTTVDKHTGAASHGGDKNSSARSWPKLAGVDMTAGESVSVQQSMLHSMTRWRNVQAAIGTLAIVVPGLILVWALLDRNQDAPVAVPAISLPDPMAPRAVVVPEIAPLHGVNSEPLPPLRVDIVFTSPRSNGQSGQKAVQPQPPQPVISPAKALPISVPALGGTATGSNLLVALQEAEKAVHELRPWGTFQVTIKMKDQTQNGILRLTRALRISESEIELTGTYQFEDFILRHNKVMGGRSATVKATFDPSTSWFYWSSDDTAILSSWQAPRTHWSPVTRTARLSEDGNSLVGTAMRSRESGSFYAKRISEK